MKVYYKYKGETLVLDPEVDGPIAILLTDNDKELIASMADYASLYCCYDDDTNRPQDISKWLKKIKKIEAENAKTPETIVGLPMDES